MSNMNPKISIILPTYNGEKYIKRAIESVISQSFSDWELIVINDGSIDNTRKVLEPYLKNEKITYLFQENGGQAVAREKGISIAEGFYIAFIDDDDEWIDKDKLQKQVEFLEKNKDYVLVGTGGIVVDESRNKIVNYNVSESDLSIRKNILLKNPFIQSSVVVRKDALYKVGLFLMEKYIRGNEDYNLWLRIGLYGKLFNLKEAMTMYMVREGNTSLTNKGKVLKDNISLIKKYHSKYSNYFKALIFSYCKFYIFNSLQLIKNKKLRNRITIFLFKNYRKFNM